MLDSTTIETAKTIISTEMFVLICCCLLVGFALSAMRSVRIGFLARRCAWFVITVFIQLALVSGLPLCQNSYSRSGYDATHIGKFSSPPLSGLCKTSQIPHAADTSQLS
jgi:hypothetical protein